MRRLYGEDFAAVRAITRRPGVYANSGLRDMSYFSLESMD
jgi:hypothetical protein